MNINIVIQILSRSRRISLGITTLVFLISVIHLSNTLNRYSHHDSKLKVNSTVSSPVLLKDSIQVGEDCSNQFTRCQYFNPLEFVKQWESTWQSLHQNRTSSIETAPLNRCQYRTMDILAITTRSDMFRGSKNSTNKKVPFIDPTGNITFKAIQFPSTFTYKKLYKTGGTNLKAHIEKNGRTRRNVFEVINYRPLARNATVAALKFSDGHDHMSRIAPFTRSHHKVIAVVRDPVKRFVSAATQVTQISKTKNATPKELLNMVIDKVTSGFYDPHFESLVNDMVCNAGPDSNSLLFYSLYSFDSDLSMLLEAFGVADSETKINASSDAVVQFSVDDMDKEMISKVCNWYAADMMMMRSIGFKVSFCDWIDYSIS